MRSGRADRRTDPRPYSAVRGFEAAVKRLGDNELTRNWSGYAFSKHALDAWVGWWYPALAKQGVRVNAINPGPTDTAMMSVFTTALEN